MKSQDTHGMYISSCIQIRDCHDLIKLFPPDKREVGYVCIHCKLDNALDKLHFLIALCLQYVFFHRTYIYVCMQCMHINLPRVLEKFGQK